MSWKWGATARLLDGTALGHPDSQQASLQSLHLVPPLWPEFSSKAARNPGTHSGPCQGPTTPSGWTLDDRTGQGRVSRWRLGTAWFLKAVDQLSLTHQAGRGGCTKDLMGLRDSRWMTMKYSEFLKNTSQRALVVKNSPAKAGDIRCRFDPWVGKISWKRTWQLTPVLLPMDRGAWWATVHRVAKSQAQLKWLSTLLHNKLFLVENLKKYRGGKRKIAIREKKNSYHDPEMSTFIILVCSVENWPTFPLLPITFTYITLTYPPCHTPPQHTHACTSHIHTHCTYIKKRTEALDKNPY